jgi:hypothetical protein
LLHLATMPKGYNLLWISLWGNAVVINNYFPIQIVKLRCKPLLIKHFNDLIFNWATIGQQLGNKTH